jgi:1,4-dihydroxy-2-naphthoyl-CoA hydrolase
VTGRPTGVERPLPIPPARTLESVLGLEWLESREDFVHVRFEVRDELRQPMGIVHGGVYSAVAETIVSVATAVAVWEEGQLAMGMSNQASFLRPVSEGRLDGRARRRHRGPSEWLWDVDFRDEQERLCTLVTVTIAVRPRPPQAPAPPGVEGAAS